MIILEAIEAPTTLEERISASEVEVERLNRRSLNATMLIPLSALLTLAVAGVAGYFVEQLGMIQGAAMIPPVIVGGVSLTLAFRNFDRKTAAYLEATDGLRELRAEPRKLKAKADVAS